jgi:hypothetical protein
MPSFKYLAFGVSLVLGSACTTATSNLSTATSPAELPGYSQSYDRVFGAAVDAVSLLSWEVTVAQKDVGLISAKTPMSLWTYGDKVTIRVFKLDSARTDSLVRVGFTSGTDQAVDWGKNGRNQSAFFEKLNAALKTTPK